MINFKQLTQTSASKAIQTAIKPGIDGKRFICSTSTCLANDDKKKTNNKNCDDGKCSRANMDTKGYLGMPETNYLQPSKTTNTRRFVESKPEIKPEINYEREQYCREKEECKAFHKKQEEDNVKKP